MKSPQCDERKPNSQQVHLSNNPAVDSYHQSPARSTLHTFHLLKGMHIFAQQVLRLAFRPFNTNEFVWTLIVKNIIQKKIFILQNVDVHSI